HRRRRASFGSPPPDGPGGWARASSSHQGGYCHAGDALMIGRDNHEAPHADLGPHGRQNLDKTARVISLADARRARAARSPDPFGPRVNGPKPECGAISLAGVSTASHAVTALGVIAGEPSFAIRRRKLAEAMA